MNFGGLKTPFRDILDFLALNFGEGLSPPEHYIILVVSKLLISRIRYDYELQNSIKEIFEHNYKFDL